MEKKVKHVGKSVRSVFQLGKSLVISLPSDFVKTHNLKPGDSMELVFNNVLIGKPIKAELLKRQFEKIEGLEELEV